MRIPMFRGHVLQAEQQSKDLYNASHMTETRELFSSLNPILNINMALPITSWEAKRTVCKVSIINRF